MVEQVQGYLMNTSNGFQRFAEIIGILPEFNAIYIPETGKILGYFKKNELKLSSVRFYEDVSGLKQLKNLSAKVAEGKFSKKVTIEKDVLDFIESAEEDLEMAKEKVNRTYNVLEEFFDYVKSQK